MIYKGFTLNSPRIGNIPGDPPGWGKREFQAWQDLIDTVVGDATVQEKATANGHRHYRLVSQTTGNVVLSCSSDGKATFSGPIVSYCQGAARMTMTPSGGIFDMEAGTGVSIFMRAPSGQIHLETTTGNIVLATTDSANPGGITISVGGAGNACMNTVNGNISLNAGGTGDASLMTYDGNVDIGSTDVGNIALTVNSGHISLMGGNVGVKTATPGKPLDINGIIRTNDDISISDSSKGLVLKDANSTPQYWRLTVSTSGSLVITNLGTTEP